MKFYLSSAVILLALSILPESLGLPHGHHSDEDPESSSNYDLAGTEIPSNEPGWEGFASSRNGRKGKGSSKPETGDGSESTDVIAIPWPDNDNGNSTPDGDSGGSNGRSDSDEPPSDPSTAPGSGETRCQGGCHRPWSKNRPDLSESGSESSNSSRKGKCKYKPKGVKGDRGSSFRFGSTEDYELEEYDDDYLKYDDSESEPDDALGATRPDRFSGGSDNGRGQNTQGSTSDEFELEDSDGSVYSGSRDFGGRRGTVLSNEHDIPGSNIPSAKVTSKREISGNIPETCRKEAISKTDEDFRGCSEEELSVVEVTYSDATKPWVLCRCEDTKYTEDEFITVFGRIPVSMRQYIRSFIGLSPSGRGTTMAFARNSGVIVMSDASSFVALHEAAHLIDFQFEFSKSSTYRSALEQDTCAITSYAKDSRDLEDWAEGLALVLYLDIAGEVPGVSQSDLSCAQNQLDTIRQQTKSLLDGGYDEKVHTQGSSSMGSRGSSSGFGGGGRSRWEERK